MSDEEDDEDNFLDLNINPSEIEKVVTRDLESAKRRNDVAVEETKTRISGFVNRYGELLQCCSPEKDVDITQDLVHKEVDVIEAQVDDTENVPTSNVGPYVRKSIMALKEKAKIDVQVVQLMDEGQIKEKKMEMEEFYKNTLKVTRKIGKIIRNQHAGTKNEIEENKKIFENTMKDLAQKVPLPNAPTENSNDFFANFVKGVAEKTAADFEETNKRSQEMTQATQEDVANYMNTVFPSRRVTLEELESERFIKSDIQRIQGKIVEDFNRHSRLANRSIDDAKKRISRCPEEVIEGMRKFSRMSAKKIREKAMGVKDVPLDDVEQEEFVIGGETSQSFDIVENERYSDEPKTEDKEN